MELIKLTYEQPVYGFGKPEKVECKGVKFDSGKVAWLDKNDVARGLASRLRLKLTINR